MTERITRKLRAEGLRPTDETVLRVFLGFLSRSGPVDWIMSNEGSAQLILRDADWSAPTEPASLDDDCSIVWVCSGSQRHPDDGRPLLRRPLQLEDFKDLLRALEAVRAAGAAEAETSRAGGSQVPSAPVMPAPRAAAAAVDVELEFEDDDEPEGFVQTRPMSDATIATMAGQTAAGRETTRRAPAAPATAVSPPPAVESGPLPDMPMNGQSYRLRRWPPHDLLRQNAGYARLASFMAARFVPADQLASVSGVDPLVCRRFVQLLKARDMLEARSADADAGAGAGAPASVAAPGAQAAASPAATPRTRIQSTNAEAVPISENRPSRVTLGVLARLRSRFGLG